MKNKIIFSFIFIISINFSVYASANLPFKNIIIHKKPISYEEIVFIDYDENKINLSTYNNEIYILNFWATWCLPCRVEMPSLDNLQEEMGDENFQVIIVSVERTDFSKVDDFLKEINIKNLSNYHDPTTMVGKHINAKGLPITILFDKNGKEIGRYNGDFEWDSKEVIKFITKLKNS